MTIRMRLAKTIPVLWCSLALAVPGSSGAATPARKKAPTARPAARRAKPGSLASLVKAWRDSPAPSRRAAVEAYASAHAKDSLGTLARLALGVVEYQQKDFSGAISALSKAQGKLPAIADYPAYYLAAARMESKDLDAVADTLRPVRDAALRSPLAGKAWVLQARALQSTDARQAARLLRDHYAELPQPEGDVTLADCYQASKDLARAAEFYQRVYYQYLTGDAAGRAAAALLTLKDAMGSNYPPPLSEQMLRRAGRLADLHQYQDARSEYQSILGELSGVARDQARVRILAMDYLNGKTAAAGSGLRALELTPSEADAERLYYLEECARRQADDDAMMSAVGRLGEQYPKSPWRLKALVSAANRFLIANRPSDFVPLYQAAYQDFPTEAVAGLCHWKVTFQAYLRGQPDAAGLLRDHLRDYPAHATTGAALYFLGRYWEQAGQPGRARACYQRLAEAFENHYYAMLARERLARPEVKTAALSTEAAQFAAEVKLPTAKPVPTEGTRATTVRIERSRLLRSAGLDDLADGELRFGSRTDGQPALLAMEMAGETPALPLAMRIMKSMAPDYLNLRIDQAPRKFWDLLFPWPYRTDVVRSAGQRELDPNLLAGLIRQESEFDPQALSHANAYGLMQVRPPTGRLFARKMGIRFSNRLLFQPAANLRIGASIFRSMLDQNGGKLEQTLAAYNAGPNRAAEWISWNHYREPAEFVESIPFTETRDYVQAVLRNADIYRRLYR